MSALLTRTRALLTRSRQPQDQRLSQIEVASAKLEAAMRELENSRRLLDKMLVEPAKPRSKTEIESIASLAKEQITQEHLTTRHIWTRVTALIIALATAFLVYKAKIEIDHPKVQEIVRIVIIAAPLLLLLAVLVPGAADITVTAKFNFNNLRGFLVIIFTSLAVTMSRRLRLAPRPTGDKVEGRMGAAPPRLCVV